jgi:signal transduction histidine kinase/CheY-like chemotaxis protein
MMEGEVDGSLYKAILDALPVGVAFAVPVPSKHAHKHHDRQSNANAATGGTPRAKDFRFVYINERMEELTRRDGGALGIDGLTLQPGDSLGQLAKQQKKKRDAMLASSSPAREEGEMIGSAESGEAKTVIKKKKTKKGKSSRSGPLTRLLKAHKHAWRTGDEVEVMIANTSNHLVRPLKIGQQIVGLLTIVQTPVGCCGPEEKEETAHKEQLKQLNEKLEQAKVLERSRSRFVADMSHEIRTPMNGLIGMVSLLADDDELTSLQREFVDTMHASAQHLLMLINDVLDYSKMSMADEVGSTSPKLKITSAPLNLCAVVHDCVSTYASQARDVGVDIITHFAPGIVKHPFYFGDSLRLRQVLANLVSNAVKFTKEGYVLIDVDYGRVRRRSTTEYGIDGEPDHPREIVFRVIDTGLGVKREDMDKIFLPYVQEDSREAESFGGTGLGLSIARQIANLMGGSLELESSNRRGRRRSIDPTSTIQRGITTIRSSLKLSSSDDNVPSFTAHSLYPCPSPLYEPFSRFSGSTFTLRLPMKIDSASAAATAPSCLPTLRMSTDSMSPTIPLRVLLVGLPPVLAATIQDLLSSFGAKCKSVGEEEAKRLLCRPMLQSKSNKDLQHWDVAAVFKGPGDGYMELAKRVRKEEKVQAREKIKLLLLAYTPDQVDTKSLEDNGWDAYLGLPVHPTVMLQMMARLRDEVNRKAEKRVYRRIQQKSEQDELERARKEWQQKNKKTPDSPKRERATLRSVLRRNKESHSAERLPTPERLVFIENSKERQSKKTVSGKAKPKPKLITKYSFLSMKPKAAVTNKWGALTALVVDDNAINRKVAIRMLESIGFKRNKITHAHDGQEALEKAREKMFDLILMDCFMPRMNGWETSELLRSEGYRGTIIATTGVATATDIARCMRSGMECCLQKPLVLDVFRDTLNNVLNARLASPPAAASSSSSSSAGSSAELLPSSPDPCSPAALPMSASAPSALSVPQALKERNRSL